jgi:hypothetical protein
MKYKNGEKNKLVFLGSRDLTLAILIGTIFFLPFYLINEIYTTVNIEYEFSHLPESDAELENWYRNIGIKEVKIDRSENKIIISYKKRLQEMLNPDWTFPDPES